MSFCRAAIALGLVVVAAPWATEGHAQVLTPIVDAASALPNSLANLRDVTTDPTGNVFVATDTSVLRIATDGAVAELIGPSGDGTNALQSPSALATDATGNVFVAGLNSNNVFKIAPSGSITQVIDSSGDGSLDPSGVAIRPLTNPSGLAVAPNGILYVSGSNSHNVFKISPVGVITELLDASGAGVGAMESPGDIEIDGDGNVFVAGRSSDNVFKISGAGVVEVVLDAAGDGTNLLSRPEDLAVDADGTLFVVGSLSDNVFEVTSAGAVTQILDTSSVVPLFESPVEVVVDGLANVFVAETERDRIFKISRCGEISEVVNLTSLGTPLLQNVTSMHLDSDGNLFVAYDLAQIVVRRSAEPLRLGGPIATGTLAYTVTGGQVGTVAGALTLDATVHQAFGTCFELGAELAGGEIPFTGNYAFEDASFVDGTFDLHLQTADPSVVNVDVVGDFVGTPVESDWVGAATSLAGSLFADLPAGATVTLDGHNTIDAPFQVVGTFSINAAASVETAESPDGCVGVDCEVTTVVEAVYVDPVDGVVPFSSEVSFSSVEASGETTVTGLSNVAAAVPANIALDVGGLTSTFFDVSTTADVTFPATICFGYDDQDSDGFVDGTTVPALGLKLLHRPAPGADFVDETTLVDTVNRQVCGEVDSLSPFVLGVTTVNIAPTADPGGPYACEPGELITLDGTGSFDPEGALASYAWDIGADGITDCSTPTCPTTCGPVGVVDASLTVGDDAGGTSQQFTTITSTLCGNSSVDAGETCDDGNRDDGDCCSSSCQAESSGSSCSDGNICNGDETCDGAGVCSAGAPPVCDDGDVCTQDSCVPQTGCLSVEGPALICEGPWQKATLLISEAAAGKEKLVAKLVKGPALDASDFGDPIGGASIYDICLYADSGALVGRMRVDRAGDSCDGKDCFKAVGTKGYLYKDKLGSADGIQLMRLLGGADGKSKILIKGKNNEKKGQLGLPVGVAASLVGSDSATLQVHMSEAPVSCVGATLVDVIKNDGVQFKAK